MPAVTSISDIQIDKEVPLLRKSVDAATLVRYAGASDDYVYLHWDKSRVVDEGFPDVIIHGWLTFAYMCQAVSEWIPREIADISTYSVRYHRPTFPGEVICSGRVTNVEPSGNAVLVELELWAKGQDGEITTTGKMRLRVRKDDA